MSTTIKQAINEFLLSCKVEGKSYGTIECYSDKLKGFLWYATNYDWPDDIAEITTQHLREFLAYLRETPHRFNSTCPRAMKPINNTTIQKYYRALSALFNWSINEGILETSSLVKIKVPKAEKKVIKALISTEVNQIISALGNTFEGIRNRAIILILVDCYAGHCSVNASNGVNFLDYRVDLVRGVYFYYNDGIIGASHTVNRLYFAS